MGTAPPAVPETCTAVRAAYAPALARGRWTAKPAAPTAPGPGPSWPARTTDTVNAHLTVLEQVVTQLGLGPAVVRRDDIPELRAPHPGRPPAEALPARRLLPPAQQAGRVQALDNGYGPSNGDVDPRQVEEMYECASA
ncbi:hypothetical protein AB0392_33760, partial [Nonomuraea angiospora]